MTDRLKKILLGEQGLVVIFVVAFALVSLLVPNFLTDRNMLGLLQSVVTVGIVACTMMFCLAARDFEIDPEQDLAAVVAGLQALNAEHRHAPQAACRRLRPDRRREHRIGSAPT